MIKNNDKIMVSVLCTSYNHEPYIRDCLDSIIKQKTNFIFEVIVHDDASTDGSAKIIKEYEAKYPDIIKPIYQKENQYSQSISIYEKFLFPKAKGKYIAFCECDDFWCDPQKLQLQFNALKKYSNCSACCHITNAVNFQTKQHLYYLNKRKINSGVVKNSIIMKEALTGVCRLHISSLMFRKEILVYFYKYRDKYFYFPFYDWSIEMFLAYSGNFFYYNKVLSCYRVSVPDGAMDKVFNKYTFNVDDLKKSINNFYNFNVLTQKKYNTEILNCIDVQYERLGMAYWKDFLDKNNKYKIYKNHKKEIQNLSYKLKFKMFLHLKCPKIYYLLNIHKKRKVIRS